MLYWYCKLRLIGLWSLILLPLLHPITAQLANIIIVYWMLVLTIGNSVDNAAARRLPTLKDSWPMLASIAYTTTTWYVTWDYDDHFGAINALCVTAITVICYVVAVIVTLERMHRKRRKDIERG